jgi:hypothetical protein
MTARHPAAAGPLGEGWAIGSSWPEQAVVRRKTTSRVATGDA